MIAYLSYTKRCATVKTKTVRILIFVILILAVSCKSLRNNSNVGKIGDSDYYILKFDPNENYPIFKNAQPAELSHEEIIATEKIIKSQI